VPFALGGKTEISNLRLLCSAHNKLEAEKVFGKWTSIENLSTIGSTGVLCRKDTDVKNDLNVVCDTQKHHFD